MIKVKVPQKIKIGAHTYSIRLNRHLLSDSNNHGAVNHRTQLIEIQADNPSDLKTETLVHEIIHVGSFCYRINIDDADTDRVAETITQFMSELGIELDWSGIKER